MICVFCKYIKISGNLKKIDWKYATAGCFKIDPISVLFVCFVTWALLKPVMLS